MAEGLSLPDGTVPAATAVDIENSDADFSRMMAQAAENVSGPAENEPAAPPNRVVDTTDPGYTPNPGPKRGRPTRETRARTREAKPGDAKPGAKAAELKPKDFRSDLTAIGDGLWLGLSSIPVTAPYAALVHMHQAGLVDAINQGAQVNPSVRNAVEKMTPGTGSAWALQLGIIGVNIGMQAWSLAKDPELRRQVMDANSQQVQNYMQQMGAVQVAEAA
jgi:hypothetical protein